MTTALATGSSATAISTRDSATSQGTPVIGVVVLNWNGIDTTRLILSDLFASEQTSIRVYLVDNGSTTAEGQMLSAEFPELSLVALSKNVGFARGVNAGAARALGDGCSHILLLNNDARIDPHIVISQLLGAMASDPSVGAAGPLVLNADGSLQSSGYEYSMWWPIPRPQPKATTHSQSSETFYLSGSCLLIRAEAFRAAGGMDGDYFLYGDDVDFALKMRAKGYREVLVDSVSIRHARASATTLYSSKYAYTALRSNLIVVAKHAKTYQVPSAIVACLGASVALAALGVAHGQYDVPGAVARAWLDFMRGRWYGYAGSAERLDDAGR